MTDVVIWKGNEESEKCDNISCGRAFSLLSRRHHCRNCGGLFCNSCTQQKITIPKGESSRRRKVCKECYTKCQANLAVPRGLDSYHCSCCIRLGGSRAELVAAGYTVHADQVAEGCSWKVVSNSLTSNTAYYLLVSVGDPSPEAALETMFDNGMRAIETHNGITIHGAMYSLIQSQLRHIECCIEQLPKQSTFPKHVVFTGFGIGGSLATIAMMEVSATLSNSSSYVLEALTFGAPSFLASELTDKHKNHGPVQRKITNFVLNFDLIPRMLSLSAEKQRDVLKHLEHSGKSVRDTGPIYYPIGTIVFIQCSTDLPCISLRCSCGVVQPHAAAAPRNDPGMKLLQFLPLEKFADISIPKALFDHNLGLYSASVRLVAKTGWGCLPSKHSPSHKNHHHGRNLCKGMFYNTSQRSVHVISPDNSIEIKPHQESSLQIADNKVVLEAGGTGSCLVDIEGTSSVVELDVRVRMMQHSYISAPSKSSSLSSTSPPVSPSGSSRTPRTKDCCDLFFEVAAGDVCHCPFIIDSSHIYPVCIRISRGLLIIVYHNPGRPTICKPLRTLDTLTTPIRFKSSNTDVWSVIMRFSYENNQKQYIRICFRESSQACQLYDLLKHLVVATTECDETIISLSDVNVFVNGDRDLESLSSSSTHSEIAPCMVQYKGDSCSWSLTASPVLGTVICRYNNECYNNPEPVYDEDGNFTRAPSAAAADRWLALHCLSHNIASQNLPVWRCEVTDSEYPPLIEMLGK